MNALRDAFEAARLDPARIDPALALAAARLERGPDDPVISAYLGALHAMRAGAATLPWIKMRHANTAISLLDEAFERREGAGAAADWPADLEILLLRGIAYANFPSFLGQAATARRCLEAARDHPAFAAVPQRYRALACAHLAVLCHRDQQADAARGHLERALQADAPAAEPIWAAR